MPSKERIPFDRFLQDVSPANLDFVLELHRMLEGLGYSHRIEQAKSGLVVSYETPKTKKVLLNYLFRKTGLLMRLYGDHVPAYVEVVQALPPAMVEAIGAHPDCKRLKNPADCNSRCPMGYAFEAHGKLFQKCRYHCFLFPVDESTKPSLTTMVEKETAARAAA